MRQIKKTTKEAAKECWKAIITKNSGEKFDMGEQEFSGIAKLLATYSNSINEKELSDEKIKIFEEALDMEIEKAKGNLTLTSDYAPEGILSQLVEMAKIPESCIPWKTTMNITPNKVEVSMGYGKPFEVIFEKAE